MNDEQKERVEKLIDWIDDNITGLSVDDVESLRKVITEIIYE